MSSRNDETTGIAMAFAMVGAMVYFAILVVFAVLAFFALVLTVLALCAWNAPLRLGKMSIEPDEARIFVMRGIAGAVLLPLFALFSALLLGFVIPDEAWFYLLVAGYTGGSIGIEILIASEAGAAQNQPPVYTPPETRLPPPRTSTPPFVPSEPFRFASWDDEEERE